MTSVRVFSICRHTCKGCMIWFRRLSIAIFLTMFFITGSSIAQGAGGAIFINSSGWKLGTSRPVFLSKPVIAYGTVLVTQNFRNGNSFLFLVNKDTLETNPCDDVHISFNPCDNIPSDVDNTTIESLKMLSLELFPNPSSTEVRMEVYSPASKFVDVYIYDMAGNQIYNLSRIPLNSALTQIVWNLTDQKGVNVPSGQYIIEVKSDYFSDKQFLTITK